MKSLRSKFLFSPVTWIMILFWTVLMAGMGLLANTALHNQPEMVREDYYEAGLSEDQLIAQVKRAQDLNFQIQWKDSAQSLWASAQIRNQPAKGQIQVMLYRPSDHKLDQKFDLKLLYPGKYHFDTHLSKGMWKIVSIYHDGMDSLRIVQDYLQP